MTALPCLSLQLGPRSWLFAVARGFGTVDGTAAAPATLERLRAECERRLRTERFRRAVDRVPAAPTAVLGALARVNGDLFSRSASHADYVTAGCSITIAVIVAGYACVIHTGGTAAYLAHRGEISVLTGDDALSEAAHELLGRALGTSSSLDVSVSSVTFDAGDVMILMGHRVRGGVRSPSSRHARRALRRERTSAGGALRRERSRDRRTRNARGSRGRLSAQSRHASLSRRRGVDRSSRSPNCVGAIAQLIRRALPMLAALPRRHSCLLRSGGLDRTAVAAFCTGGARARVGDVATGTHAARRLPALRLPWCSRAWACYSLRGLRLILHNASNGGFWSR